MIENVENFHPELHVKVFGDSFHVVVLKQRHVQVNEARPHNAITPAIAQEVGTSARDRRAAEGDTQGRNIWSGLRKRKAIQVKIVEAAMDWVAPVHDVGKAERVSAVHSKRIRSDRDSEWHASVCLEDSAIFPTTRDPA